MAPTWAGPGLLLLENGNENVFELFFSFRVETGRRIGN